MIAKEFEAESKEYDKDYERVKNWNKIPPFEDRIKKLVPKRIDFFHKFVEYKGECKVLDVGGGDGYATYILSKRNPKAEFRLIDLSEVVVKEAKINLRNVTNVVDVKQSAAEEIEYDDGQFDVVIMSQLLEHLKEPVRAIKECHRVLKKGGYMVVSTPIGKNLLDPKHIHFFKFYDIMDIFDEVGSDYKIYKYFKQFESNTPNIFIVVMVKGKEIEEDDSNIWNEEVKND